MITEQNAGRKLGHPIIAAELKAAAWAQQSVKSLAPLRKTVCLLLADGFVHAYDFGQDVKFFAFEERQRSPAVWFISSYNPLKCWF